MEERASKCGDSSQNLGSGGGEQASRIRHALPDEVIHLHTDYAGDVAVFSEPKAEAPALALSGEAATDPVTARTCDMLQSGNGRYYSGRLSVTLSSLLTPALCCEEADARLFSLPTRVQH